MTIHHKTALAAIAAVFLGAWMVPSGAQPCPARQLMTPQEWAQHQAIMRNLPPAQREAYRAQHHEQMKQRAAAKGLILPQQLPPMGMGIGRVMGPGAWGPGYQPGVPWHRGWGRPAWGRGPGGPWRRGWGW